MNDAGQIGTGSAEFDAEQFSLAESEMLTHQRIEVNSRSDNAAPEFSVIISQAMG